MSRRYTERVHIAGTQANNKLRDTLLYQLQQQLHLPVTLYTYDTLLSYPNWSVQCELFAHVLKSENKWCSVLQSLGCYRTFSQKI